MNLKKELLHACKQKVRDKVELLQESMQEIQNAANDETKSSAGDKFETGRAMMHLEKEKLARQLAEQLKLLEVLSQIDPTLSYKEGRLGALMQTSAGNYFLSASLGKIILDGESYFALSVAAPLGQQLLKKQVEDQLEFRGKSINIQAIQ